MRELKITAIFAVIFAAVSHAPEGQEILHSRPLPSVLISAPKAPAGGIEIPETKKEILLKALSESLQKALWLNDYSDLDNAEKTGRLVAIRDGPEAGFILRKTGKWCIGEREKRLRYREKFYRLSKPAAGLLHLLTDKLRAGLGEEFVPLDITSLVRTAKYQKRLAAVNANADVKKIGIPPTHVLGLAFDIAWAKMPKTEIKLLLETLRELSAEGKAVYFLEGATAAALHVIALPQAEKEFAEYYDKANFAVINAGAGMK